MIKKNYGRLLWYEMDDNFQLKKNEKGGKIAGCTKIEDCKVIGFVD